MALTNGAPIATPALGANRRGLLSPGGAIRLDDPDDRWLGGFAYEEWSCDALAPLPMLCEQGEKDTNDKPGIREYQPVLLFGTDVCTTLDQSRDAVAHARQNLLATESFQLEREVWDGVATRAATPDLVNDYLAIGGAGGATVLEASAVPYVNALALLDQALAECLHGTQGMVHAMPLTVALWVAAGAVRVEGQRLLTPMDNIVVAGSGYSGSAPGAQAGDAPIAPADATLAANAYATGLVYVRLGAEERIGQSASEEVDRSTNTRTVIVERPAAATWSGCCAFTVEVDHTTETGPPDGGGA